MLKALIVDDEALARRGLEIRLQHVDDLQIVGQCANGREALHAIREQKPDIMFLDVQMPGMSGFDVLAQIPSSEMPAVIFVTAFDEFALKAFDANAIDYLLKPINDDRLSEAIVRARNLLGEHEAYEHCSKLLKLICDLKGRDITLDDALSEADGEAAQFPSKLAIQDGRETNCVDVEAIDWVDAAGDYMCIHVGGETLVLRGTMKKLEQLLNPDIFVRVHRSTIVNRHRVRTLRPHRNGEYYLTLNCDHELKLSRKYKNNVRRFAHAV
ncbi:MAG: LytTR family DNA-binding domain-containing protein [Gammaproteobacteria bacterium]|nr:LytTR family DNA-binding domain-containing protein [Gammaproteobacteria bacterium]